jgi:aryl-alcohol dehydrogenase-like predicted oxidoreductase
MKYNRLGRNNLSVSELGFGTAQIGGPSVIKGKPFGAKPVSDNEASKILTQAYDAGINVYDSSDMYGDGLAEKRLGEFFKKRDDVVFATKCGFTRNGNRCFSKDYVMKSVEDSLRRLKRERIDLYQFSKPTLTDSNNYDLEKTVMRLKKQGKIAYAGISVGRIEDGLGFLKQHIWDSLQIIYNLLTLDFKKLISEACAKKIGIIIRSPLSSGMLTGKLGENTKFPSQTTVQLSCMGIFFIKD